jgi:uncharacterized UBP type Zn finger protein
MELDSNNENKQNEMLEEEEDIFTLSGVLVHSGSAEAGHYYSFIKQ